MLTFTTPTVTDAQLRAAHKRLDLYAHPVRAYHNHSGYVMTGADRDAAAERARAMWAKHRAENGSVRMKALTGRSLGVRMAP